MSAGIHPEVLRLSRARQVSIGAAHAMWLESIKDLPPIQGGSCYVTCTACQMWHHLDDDCPAPVRHPYFTGDQEA